MGPQREQHPSGDGKLTAADANLPSPGSLPLPALATVSLEGPIAVMSISWQHPRAGGGRADGPLCEMQRLGRTEAEFTVASGFE